MRILFLGDIVGQAGVNVVAEHVPIARSQWKLDAVIANGENAAKGFGIDDQQCATLLHSGVDVITLGNHCFDQKEMVITLDQRVEVLRPCNFPSSTPGKGVGMIHTVDHCRILVINAIGRIFMGLADDPFSAIDAILDESNLGEVADAIIVDFHAEATSEKQALACYLDGRVSAVIGTHTHVPTSDYRILPHGTAYCSDVGMCGDFDSIIGMEKDEPVRRFMHRTPGKRFVAAKGVATLCGLAIEIERSTGLAKSIAPVCIGPQLSIQLPEGWKN